MTSTSNTPTSAKLLNSGYAHIRDIGTSLSAAISKYSRNKDGSPAEITDGLRILGSPIGSIPFCKSFIQSALDKAKSDSTILLDQLNSRQTILQLYRTCTQHKLTHLLASDVLTTDFDILPESLFLWDSDITTNFNNMTHTVLSTLTDRTSIPNHAFHIATMSTKQGGLGLLDPRTSAIPTLLLQLRKGIQYSTDGIWVSKTQPNVPLPPNISSLF